MVFYINEYFLKEFRIFLVHLKVKFLLKITEHTYRYGLSDPTFKKNRKKQSILYAIGMEFFVEHSRTPGVCS